VGNENEIGRLMIEGGFPDEISLISFCMSVGVFHNRRMKHGSIPFGLKVDDLTSYEVCSLIINDQSEEELELREMNMLLEEHLLGGINMILEEIKGTSGLESLKRASKLMPP
jgi:hypothetical protein